MLPFIHILSGKYFSSILTIPRPAILQRTLWSEQLGQVLSSSQNTFRSELVVLIRMGPYSPVLRVLGHLEDVETYVDKANVSSQLHKVHNLHVLIKALKPDQYSMRIACDYHDGYLFPLMLSWRTMLGWYISHSWLFRNMLSRSWERTKATWPKVMHKLLVVKANFLTLSRLGPFFCSFPCFFWGWVEEKWSVVGQSNWPRTGGWRGWEECPPGLENELEWDCSREDSSSLYEEEREMWEDDT